MSRAGLTLFVAFALAGCSWLNTMTARRVPDQRIVLEPMQRMDFSRVSRRNSSRQHIDEFRCPAEHVMVCVDRGAVYECTCWRKGP